MQFQRKIARRYARALSETLSEGDWSKAEAALFELSSLIEDTQIIELLSNPRFLLKERKSCIKELVEQKVQEEKICLPLVRTLELLMEGKRLRDLRTLAEEFSSFIRRARHEEEVTVITPQVLNGEERTPIIANLKERFGGSVRIEWLLDPSLIGGMQLKRGNNIFDGSLRGALQDFAGILRKSTLV